MNKPYLYYWAKAKLNQLMVLHRSNLIRKDPKFYQPKWPGVPDNLPYVWPASG